MTAITCPNPLLRTYNTGSSDVSMRLQEIIENTFRDLRNSVTWSRTCEPLGELRETFAECAENDWDGYGAKAITAATYDEAIRFLNSLPSDIALPDIVPEPSGEIGFEWNNGANKILAVSVSGTNVITYAGILGKGNKAHGTEIFNDSTPANILENIRRIYP
jgi:hypothetical protein